MCMKIFLDTGSFEEVAALAPTGLIDGVTTNPSLLFHAGGNPLEIIKKMRDYIPSAILSVQITEQSPDKIYTQAHELFKINDNIAVKIPCVFDYYPVIKTLVAEGIRINVTLVFSLVQGLCMSKLGVAYISPFMGRLDDAGYDSYELIAMLCDAKRKYGFKTEILAASIRNEEHIVTAIQCGVDIITVSSSLLQKITHHELTDAGVSIFMNDWAKIGVKQFP